MRRPDEPLQDVVPHFPERDNVYMAHRAFFDPTYGTRGIRATVPFGDDFAFSVDADRHLGSIGTSWVFATSVVHISTVVHSRLCTSACVEVCV